MPRPGLRSSTRAPDASSETGTETGTGTESGTKPALTLAEARASEAARAALRAAARAAELAPAPGRASAPALAPDGDLRCAGPARPEERAAAFATALIGLDPEGLSYREELASFPARARRPLAAAHPDEPEWPRAPAGVTWASREGPRRGCGCRGHAALAVPILFALLMSALLAARLGYGWRLPFV